MRSNLATAAITGLLPRFVAAVDGVCYNEFVCQDLLVIARSVTIDYHRFLTPWGYSQLQVLADGKRG